MEAEHFAQTILSTYIGGEFSMAITAGDCTAIKLARVYTESLGASRKI
jgi:hypothetical protein